MLRNVRLIDEFADYAQSAPPEATASPSMLSPMERSFLFNAAAKYFQGAGYIFDMGIFLGGSTTSFGEGFRQNPHRDEILARLHKPIRSFELAQYIPDWRRLFEKFGLPLDLQPGDSFAEHVVRFTEQVADFVDLRFGDVTETSLGDERIEILFIDIMKTPAIGNFVVREHFPKLIPGRSLVIEQDFFTAELPYILVLHEALAQHCEYIGEIGATAVFRWRSPISRDEAAACSVDQISPDRQFDLASRALDRTSSPQRRYMVAMGLAYLRLVHHGAEAARDYLTEIDADIRPAADEARYARLRAARARLEKTIAQSDGHAGWCRLPWLRPDTVMVMR